MSDLAESLTAEQARQCVAAYLDAVDYLDATGDRQAFVARMRRAVRLTEHCAQEVPQAQQRDNSWPACARLLASDLAANGTGPYQIAQRLAEEYQRPCSHGLVRRWLRRAA